MTLAHPPVSPMHRIALQAWQAMDFALGEGDPSTIGNIAGDDPRWVAVTAPGDIYLALHAAGRLPDPFGDRNEEACAWVKDREWWWQTRFDAPALADGQRLRLIFEGLDTFASLWLNGRLLGDTDNMFRAWTFDVGELLRPGSNHLLVRFSPTSTAVAGKQMPLWSIISDPIEQTKRNFIRKAQFGWGWDWAPRLATVGIWKPVRLQLDTLTSLAQVKFDTLELAVDHASARVAVAIALDRFGDGAALQAEISLTDADCNLVASERLALHGPAAECAFSIQAPRLWWTPELGAAHLYRLCVVLRDGERTIDRRELRVGIRTIALDTSPDSDEPGTQFFRFVLNGVPIFARGACWIPPSSLVGAVDASHYRRLVGMAAQANMNMLRIWGGGIYEHEAFYDSCDELGLLVWQDFMFACAPYPEHEPAFVENVRAEVRQQILRLRHHASLALWCGNNEGQAVQGFMNRMNGRAEPLLGALYYDQLMPEALRELDPATPYWPGSPTGGPSDNSMLGGDVHSWTVWHGLPPVPEELPVGAFDHSPEGVAYTRYAEEMGRFISEYGIQAAPVMETLRRALPDDQRVLDSEGLLYRIKDRPKDKVEAMMLPVTGLPRTLDEYVRFTQITQAEGLKFGIEHFRRRKPHCSGSLIWQYNDCWPGISWSLVDYYGFGKAAYYYTRRAYAPVLASFKGLPSGEVELWLTNDTAHLLIDQAIVEYGRTEQGLVWSQALPLNIPPYASLAVWRSDVAKAPAGADGYLRVHSATAAFPANPYYFALPRDRPPHAAAQPAMDIEVVSAHELRVHLSASRHLYFVHLLLTQDWTECSDNYFDMAPGERRVIDVRNQVSRLDPRQLQVACG